MRPILSRITTEVGLVQLSARWPYDAYLLLMVFFSQLPPKPDRRFVIENYEPVYLETWRRGLLEAKVER